MKLLHCLNIPTAALLGAACFVTGHSQSLPPNESVYASGLNNPRGLTFGPDGYLYIAEGGAGGLMATTPAQCEQVPTPVGPYTGGFTSRISKVDTHGNVTTVINAGPPARPAQARAVWSAASPTWRLSGTRCTQSPPVRDALMVSVARPTGSSRSIRITPGP